jgi:hypothetical protein
MRVADLIQLLQEVDPTGELPVCVHNADVYSVAAEPAYYDGSLQQLVHDPDKRGNSYSIVGAKLIRNGTKVVIKPMSVRDAFLDDISLPVETDSESDKARVETWREEIKAALEKEPFYLKESALLEIEDRLAKATQGEWYVEHSDTCSEEYHSKCAVRVRQEASDGAPQVSFEIARVSGGGTRQSTDAQFIACAKQDISLLLKHIRSMEP